MLCILFIFAHKKTIKRTQYEETFLKPVPPIQKSFYWIMIWLIENLFISLQSEPKRYDYELLTNGTT